MYIVIDNNYHCQLEYEKNWVSACSYFISITVSINYKFFMKVVTSAHGKHTLLCKHIPNISKEETQV